MREQKAERINDIIIYGRHFGAITNCLQADAHQHGLIQFFLSANKELTIDIEGHRISGQAFIVNAYTMHTFHSRNDVHFTMLIDPTTQLGRNIRTNYLEDRPYILMDEKVCSDLQKKLKEAINGSDRDKVMFMKEIHPYFTRDSYTPFDARVTELLHKLTHCHCNELAHQVQMLAAEMFLSESRLSHLFKQETGMPLKSYLVLHQLQNAYRKIIAGKSLTEAAIESGFHSSSHFAATNKRMTGMAARDLLEDSRFLKVYESLGCYNRTIQ